MTAEKEVLRYDCNPPPPEEEEVPGDEPLHNLFVLYGDVSMFRNGWYNRNPVTWQNDWQESPDVNWIVSSDFGGPDGNLQIVARQVSNEYYVRILDTWTPFWTVVSKPTFQIWNGPPIPQDPEDDPPPKNILLHTIADFDFNTWLEFDDIAAYQYVFFFMVGHWVLKDEHGAEHDNYASRVETDIWTPADLP